MPYLDAVRTVNPKRLGQPTALAFDDDPAGLEPVSSTMSGKVKSPVVGQMDPQQRAEASGVPPWAQPSFRADVGSYMTDPEYAQRNAASDANMVAEASRAREQGRMESESAGRASQQPVGSRMVASSAPATALQDAYRQYVGGSSVPITSAAAPSPTLDLSPVTSLVQSLTANASADRERQQAQQQAMRALLMGRIGEASKPVDVNAPGIKETLAAQRLARQRAAERQRSQTAVRLSSEGLLDSGAFDTAISGIEQARGEGEASDIANTLLPEHQAKRQELLQLYQMAIAQGDAEAARALQEQLAAIDSTMAGINAQESRSRFSEDAGFRRSSFLDNLNLQLLLAGAR